MGYLLINESSDYVFRLSFLLPCLHGSAYDYTMMLKRILCRRCTVQMAEASSVLPQASACLWMLVHNKL